jgi:hypothetical protein
VFFNLHVDKRHRYPPYLYKARRTNVVSKFLGRIS